MFSCKKNYIKKCMLEKTIYTCENLNNISHGRTHKLRNIRTVFIIPNNVNSDEIEV